MSTVTLVCDNCNKIFERDHTQTGEGKRCPQKNIFCSYKCNGNFHNQKINLPCANCGSEVIRTQAEYRGSKSGNIFCDKSCAATYNNLHKTIGTRRSKLEKWLENKLPGIYPDLDFKFNSKEEINSELDIYISSLRLAFELNGIYHYEPIHGQEKLASVQNNDDRKFQACIDYGIELCIIDTSGLKYFKEKNAQKYLDIICGVINRISY